MAEETKPEIKNVYEAVQYVYSQVEYVQKTGKVEINRNSKYNVATEQDFLSVLRPAFRMAGLQVRPVSIEQILNDTVDIVKPGFKPGDSDRVVTTYRTKALYTFEFVHAESNTSMTAVGIGEGIDTGDKASYKCATGALKYALRQAFMIETGDDPDNHASEENRAKSKKNDSRQLLSLAESVRYFDELKEMIVLAMRVVHDDPKKNEFLSQMNERLGTGKPISEKQIAYIKSLASKAEEKLMQGQTLAQELDDEVPF